MFDVSFSELLMIGVIALIVIGPERLPKVARTIGHLVGRAQRYVSDVKTDIQREMDLDEISSLKSQLQDAANTIKETVKTTGDDLRKPVDEAQSALKEASESLKAATTTESTKTVSLPEPVSEPLSEPPPEPAPAAKPPTETPT